MTFSLIILQVMFTYHNHGLVNYHRQPVAVNGRTCYEFQAVLSGFMQAIIPQAPQAAHQHSLWLFPPKHQHGWSNPHDQRCERLVWHFPHLPDIVQGLVSDQQFLRVDLNQDEQQLLHQLSQRTQQHISKPTEESQLHAECVRHELSIIILKEQGKRPLNDKHIHYTHTVERALAWYSANLSASPNLDDIAQAIHSSPAHLRRMFHAIRGCSPKQALRDIQMQHACFLLQDYELGMEAIAEACGFSAASAFSRAFSMHMHCSPLDYRQKQHWRRYHHKKS